METDNSFQTDNSFPLISSLGAKKVLSFGYYGRYYSTVYTVPCQGNHLPYKRGPWGGGGKKTSEHANNTGQAWGTWKTHRPNHSCRCAVARTKKYMRRGLGDCLNVKGKRREKVGSQRCQTHEEGARQEDLLESTLTSTGTAPQCPRFPNPLQPQKNPEAERTQHCDFFRGWSGKFEGKKNEHTSGSRIFANPVSHILLFPKQLLPLDKTFFFTWKTSLGANFVLGTMAGTTVLYTQYSARQGNQCNVRVLLLNLSLLLPSQCRRTRQLTSSSPIYEVLAPVLFGQCARTPVRICLSVCSPWFPTLSHVVWPLT
jgi:hypothetical protein